MATVAAVILILTGGAIAGLLRWVNTSGITGTELTTARLDAVKIGLSIAIGGGGVFALYLAWRRQRSNEADHQQRERALEHQQQVADDTKHDALERRVTDLYTKAAEQLGSDRAPVRLAGLYALERLAQDNAQQRQTIVNVLCAYLRMPYEPPSAFTSDGVEKPESMSNFARSTDAGNRSVEEREVRLAAQRILTGHLRPLPGPVEDRAGPGHRPFWPGIDLDLTGAVLIDFDLSQCRFRSAHFERAYFAGNTAFKLVTSQYYVSFASATFSDTVEFDRAHLHEIAIFSRAHFEGDTSFADTRLGEPYVDSDADRERLAAVRDKLSARLRVALGQGISFNGTEFRKNADFSGASFDVHTTFEDVKFAVPADFRKTRFAKEVPPQVRDQINNPREAAYANTSEPTRDGEGSEALDVPTGEGADPVK